VTRTQQYDGSDGSSFSMSCVMMLFHMQRLNTTNEI
jgi:hypothetical protein